MDTDSTAADRLDALIARPPGGISARREDRVLAIEIDRPERRGAMDLGMWQRIRDLVLAAQDDDRIRVVAFSGKDDRAFSAGADIGEFATVRSGVDNVLNYQEVVGQAEQAIITSAKPTAALIRGWCMGGGCEIAAACAIRVGDASARFGITPAKLGIVYGQTSIRRLVEEVGAPWARFLLLTGRTIDAETALRIGLLHQIFDADRVADEWQALLGTLVGNAPVSQLGAMQFIARVTEGSAAEDRFAMDWYRRSAESEEYQRGVRSFLTKVKPDFSDIPWPGPLPPG